MSLLILCFALLSWSLVWLLCVPLRVLYHLCECCQLMSVVELLRFFAHMWVKMTLTHCSSVLPVYRTFPNTTATESDEFHVFSPPCDRCVRCQSHLVRYNNPVEVDYHHMNGSSKGIKCSLKCSRCDIFYGYTKYGNPVSGWNLYSAPRPAVEASDVCFVQRTLLKFQISLT